MSSSKIIALQEQIWWRVELESVPLVQLLVVTNHSLPEMAPPKCTLVRVVTLFHPDVICQVLEVLEGIPIPETECQGTDLLLGDIGLKRLFHGKE